MKIFDRYIIKKFLGTYVFLTLIMIAIAIVFDFSEKIDDFFEKNAPWDLVFSEYYLNFIPYFATLYSHLFTFISVIFITSRMSYNLEILAILSNGVSLYRLTVPYLISAVIIMVFSFTMNNWVIPPTSAKRLEFEDQYLKKARRRSNRHIHKQIQPGVFVYMESYNRKADLGYKFSMEGIDSSDLKYKLRSDYVRWDTTKTKWVLTNYFVRRFVNGKEIIEKGRYKDTTLFMSTSDFNEKPTVVETLKLGELNDYIAKQEMQGVMAIKSSLIEREKRYAFPFAALILSIIGLAVAVRLIKGGSGMHIIIGVGFAFAYIFFMQLSSQYAVNDLMSTKLAIWMPNILFACIAAVLYKNAPK